MTTPRSAPESRVEMLARALLFYADPDSYEESTDPHPTRFASGVVPIEADCGAIARAALAALPSPEEGRRMNVADPTAITGTWSDLERRARYLWRTGDSEPGSGPHSDAYEMAEAVLVLLGIAAREVERREQCEDQLYASR